MRILLAEDDPFTGEMLTLQLRKENWSVEWTKDGHDALKLHLENKYDLLLLDWMLPGPDGIEICSLLRQQGDSVPVIMLTSRNAVDDCITGLGCGADDYIPKPFAFPELLARIRSLIRRVKSINAVAAAKTGKFEYYADERAVVADRQIVYLSKREAALFELLLRQESRPVSRERLAVTIWQDKRGSTDAVDPLISQLRRRLEPLRYLCSIENERGSGFVLRLERKPEGEE